MLDLPLKIYGDILPAKYRPEPKAFTEERDMKVLENFLWDIVVYFCTTHTSEQEKVNLASMFLVGDAKLWWRTMCACIGDDKVETWEDLSRELHAQFFPTNMVWVA